MPDHAANAATPTAAPAYLTADIPGVGGTIKQRPEDFLVEELPSYQPSGKGEHVYLCVQKRGLSTFDMLRIIAKHFGVPVKSVGYAGLKDKSAITRQIVSVHTPKKTHADFPMLQHEHVQVLWADMHDNKLRPGHLRGNRFSIRIRHVRPEDVRAALRTVRTLQDQGVPNRFGEQRFGIARNNHGIGRCLVQGDFDGAVRELLGPCVATPDLNREARELFTQGKFREAIQAYPLQATIETRTLYNLERGRTPRQAILALDETTLRFYLSAFQSEVFNTLLDDRIRAGTLATLHVGDVAVKHANGAAFLVSEADASDAALRERLATFEVSPSGPMWGSSMLRAAGATDAAELHALAQHSVTPEQLDLFDARAPWKLEGKRRPFRVPIIDPEVEGGVDEHGPYIRCAFELPRGAFATVALREVMKTSAEGLDSAEDEP